MPHQLERLPVPVAAEGLREPFGVAVLKTGELGMARTTMLEQQDFPAGAADARHLLQRFYGVRKGAGAEAGDDGRLDRRLTLGVIPP